MVLAFHFELIFYFLSNSKFVLDEVHKAMIQVLVSHFELIYCLLTSPKCDLPMVQKAMFQLNFELWNLTFDFQLWPLTFHFEHLDSSDNSDISGISDISICSSNRIVVIVAKPNESRWFDIFGTYDISHSFPGTPWWHYIYAVPYLVRFMNLYNTQLHLPEYTMANRRLKDGFEWSLIGKMRWNLDFSVGSNWEETLFIT